MRTKDQTPNNCVTRKSKARAVMTLLGFGSVDAFADEAGVNRLTVLDIFSDNPKHSRRFDLLARIHETLVSSYRAMQAPADEKKFVKCWINRWSAKMLKDRRVYITAKSRSEHPTERALVQRVYRKNKRMHELKQLLRSIE